MNDFATPRALVDLLDKETDGSLRLIIRRARAILAERDERQKKAALEQIHQIAKEHGLTVAVKRPARKRGRPPKTDN